MSENSKKLRDFEIPIQFHTRPLNGIIDVRHTILDKPFVSDGKEIVSWSYLEPNADASKSDAGPSVPVKDAEPSGSADIVQPPKKKHKRKFEAFNPNLLPDSMFPGILRSGPKPSWEVMRSTFVTDPATGKRVPWGTVYAPEMCENNRSDNPSDREIALEKKKEAERAKQRAEAAAAKKNKKPGPKRRGSHNATASASRSRNASPAPDVEMSSSPVVNTTVAFAAPNGMKRTRSAGGGVGPISAVLANSLGAGSINVSSPLKAVTGPNTPEEIDPVDTNGNTSVEPRRGRSRLSDESISPPNQIVSGRKANSHSPTTSTIPLVNGPAPNTLPPLPHKPLPRNGSVGPSDMRRVVSASNIGKKVGHGSPLAPEAARERSKREVVLPGRLRDYDVKAGTPT